MSFLKSIRWLTAPFLVLTFLISGVGLALYIPRYGVHPLEPIVCAIFVFVIAMVVSGGYHRYFAHKTFQCHPILKIFYLIIGAAAFQQSALVWATDHRMHHRYVDTDKDPYNIKKGFWWAHAGWLFAKDPGHRANILAIAPDLVKDKWVMWQHKYWMWISIPLAVGLPLFIGYLIGRPVGMFLWAGFLRVVITHHTTFTINSIAHKFGTQPYTDENSARDVWWLAPLLCGENYHNYHHRFQSDYRNGVKWYQYDPTKWALWLLSHTPLVKNLRRTPEHLILKARLEMDLKQLEQKLKPAPAEFWMPVYTRLLGMRQAVEEAAELYAKAKKNYSDFKHNMADRSRESLEHAQETLREKELAFKKMLTQWQETIRWAYRGSVALAPNV
jgi:stearoyl-CoA desaturase (delta-9 desaturase)